MAVTSREQLKQYCLRSLGSPVININVADEQLEDRLDEAVEYWRLYHPEGIEQVYAKYMITASTLPLNLTGYTVKSQIRKSYGYSTAYNFNPSIYDAVNGKVKVQLSASQSEAIPPGRYLYDVEITQTSSGIKTRVIEGLVIVTPQITQI